MAIRCCGVWPPLSSCSVLEPPFERELYADRPTGTVVLWEGTRPKVVVVDDADDAAGWVVPGSVGNGKDAAGCTTPLSGEDVGNSFCFLKGFVAAASRITSSSSSIGGSVRDVVAGP